METNDTKKDRNKEQFQDKKGLTQDAIDNSTDTHSKSNKRLFVFGSIILLIFASFLVVFKVVFNGSFNALAKPFAPPISFSCKPLPRKPDH